MSCVKPVLKYQGNYMSTSTTQREVLAEGKWLGRPPRGYTMFENRVASTLKQGHIEPKNE